MKEKNKNRRKYQRVHFKGQLSLNFGNDSYRHCQVKNISLTGMFISGCFDNRHNQRCLIQLSHNSDSEKKHIKASGKVIWNNDAGAGVEFTSMTFDSYMSLLTALVNGAEEPVIILNEFPILCPYTISDK